ncbi:ABC transporter ATP-binding protein [Stappia sp. TSB10GB4]|uniref:ABC transporter ATP-binding protein n=1 Tax=Stappia sp. TSB10GB4 TaxID=2003584 RepID=UPI001648D96E|nr:ABC transporter ATP-binding protein [Stappia sp. TSB10GB4]
MSASSSASAGRETSPRTPIVSLQRVSKTFANATVALKDMTLDINSGEFVSLLGPSGCGKSTALRIIAGLSSPTAGRLLWPDERPGARDHAISFVFQEPTLMPWATVFDNVHLPLKLKGSSAETSRTAVMEALEMVGLERFARSYPRELSGGMKMRVSIARALVTKPRLLLMDEPFAALDEITRFRLNNDLLRLWEEFGWTVIFVTHSVFESVYLSNRIVVMAARPGRVVADLAVDAPYPRDETFRTSHVYSDHCRNASEALQAAMASEDDDHH